MLSKWFPRKRCSIDIDSGHCSCCGRSTFWGKPAGPVEMVSLKNISGKAVTGEPTATMVQFVSNRYTCSLERRSKWKSLMEYFSVELLTRKDLVEPGTTLSPLQPCTVEDRTMSQFLPFLDHISTALANRMFLSHNKLWCTVLKLNILKLFINHGLLKFVEVVFSISEDADGDF